MKKKIIALVLVLVLSMAMLVPAFAAEQRACSHHWVDLAMQYRYVYFDDDYHIVYCDLPQICDLCAARRTIEDYYSYSAGHNSSLYCTICNHSC